MSVHHGWDWKHVHRLALREARAVLGQGPDAEDAAQEAAIRAWRRRATCREAPAGWIRAIARNEALRVAGRHRDEAPLDDEGGIAADHASCADRRAVRAAVRSLQGADRLRPLLRHLGRPAPPRGGRA